MLCRYLCSTSQDLEKLCPVIFWLAQALEVVVLGACVSAHIHI